MGLYSVFLANQTTNCTAADVTRLPEQWYIFKRRLEYPERQIRRFWPTMGLGVLDSPTLTTSQNQINLCLHPFYLPNFISDFRRRMDGRELSDVKWQRIDVRNWRADEFQSANCT
jgi:hypothetical protein